MRSSCTPSRDTFAQQARKEGPPLLLFRPCLRLLGEELEERFAISIQALLLARSIKSNGHKTQDSSLLLGTLMGICSIGDASPLDWRRAATCSAALLDQGPYSTRRRIKYVGDRRVSWSQIPSTMYECAVEWLSFEIQGRRQGGLRKITSASRPSSPSPLACMSCCLPLFSACGIFCFSFAPAFGSALLSPTHSLTHSQNATSQMHHDATFTHTSGTFEPCPPPIESERGPPLPRQLRATRTRLGDLYVRTVQRTV